MDNERRRAERYFFSAQAEVHEAATELRVHSRVSELSQLGCYLDMMNPFPADTPVKLKIISGTRLFLPTLESSIPRPTSAPASSLSKPPARTAPSSIAGSSKPPSSLAAVFRRRGLQPRVSAS